MVSPADAQVFNIGPALAAFGAGRDMRRQQVEAQYQTGQRNALAQAGGAAAKGDLGAARDTLFRAGNLGDAFAVDQTMQQRQAATTQADAAHQAEVQRGLANLALDPSVTDAQWAQAVTQYFQIHGDQEDIAALPGSPLLDPSIRRTLAAGAMDAADYYSRTNPSGGDQFTLSPGQQRFDAAGNPIANVPEAPEQQAQIVPLQEVKQLGLDPTRAYQRLPDGRIQEIGAAGVSVRTEVQLPGEGAPDWVNALWDGKVEEINAGREMAVNSVSAMENAVSALDLVNQGINTGTLANLETFLGTLGVSLGIVDPNSDLATRAANTQTYIANRGNAVADVIQRFGAGTGLSDADREYARQIAGGQVQMTEQAIRNILRMELIANYNVAKMFNGDVAAMQEAAGNYTLPPGLSVDIPPYLEQQMPGIIASWQADRAQILTEALGADAFQQLEGGGQVQSPTSTPATGQQQFPGAPMLGTTRTFQGQTYRYIGGDPNVRESWQLVQ